MPSGEVIVPLIEAIACDIPRVVIGNVPNAADSVPGLPRDVAVEMRVLRQIDHSHSALAQPRDHAVMGEGFAYQWIHGVPH
jgi:alpha-galactosidase/6-phospho-beta-glucosidase family protein